MKNQILKVILLASFMISSCFVYAQSNEKTWSFGPELGVNFSKYGMDADESDYKSGLVAGAFLTYSIRNTHAITAKVLFSQKGAAFEDLDSKTHLNYIEIPVLVRVFFNREGTIRPNIFGGPSFGFLNGVKVKTGDEDFEDLDNYDASFNRFDFGIGLGFGLNIKVGEEMYFIIDSRYTFGLTDFSKSDDDANNQAVAISAGLSFGIGN